MENRLKNTACQTQSRARNNSSADAGHTVVANDQIHLFIGGFAEDSFNQLAHRGVIRAGAQRKQDGYQQQNSQEYQKSDTPDLILTVIR